MPAPKALAREIPWTFTRAACPAPRIGRRRLRKNPLAPSASIIRVWGVLVDYKPRRQRRWSRALVRRGAEAREAIAAVLEVPAEHIEVKDSAGPARP
jgi:hypothetical protein